MLRNMTTRAKIFLHLTNHSLRAKTITVLSAKIETCKIKAVKGHKSDTSIEGYCERPILNQFKDMSKALSCFVDENHQLQLANRLPVTLSVLPRNALGLPLTFPHSYLNSQQQNFLIENGCNPGVTLPSGTFQNC